MRNPTTRQDPCVFFKYERKGSGIAHGSGHIIGLPLVLILGLFVGMAPTFSYTQSHGVLYDYALLLAAAGLVRFSSHASLGCPSRHRLIRHLSVSDGGIFQTVPIPERRCHFDISLSCGGAWDTLLGKAFRYNGLNSLLHRYSQTNLKPQERRWRLFRPYRTENQYLNDQTQKYSEVNSSDSQSGEAARHVM